MQSNKWGWTKSLTFKSFRYGCIIYCIKNYCFTITYCVGDSMHPTINDGDVILVNRFSFRWLSYDEDFIRNKVVVVRHPEDPQIFACKRVKWTSKDSGFFREIPEGSVFIVGDNQRNSRDSRSYGPIPMGLIQGIVTYRIWPNLQRIT